MSSVQNLTRRALVAAAVATGLGAPGVESAGKPSGSKPKRKQHKQRPDHNRGPDLPPQAKDPDLGGPVRPPAVFVAAYFADLTAELAGPNYSAVFKISYIHPGKKLQGDLGAVSSVYSAGESIEAIRREADGNIKEEVIAALKRDHGEIVTADQISVTLT